jgi:hypothetical protein
MSPPFITIESVDMTTNVKVSSHPQSACWISSKTERFLIGPVNEVSIVM